MVIPDRPLVIGRGRSADITVKGGLGIGNRFARVMKNEQGTYLERCSRLVSVAVNGEYVKGVCRLDDGDSILFPQFSGVLVLGFAYLCCFKHELFV